MNIKSIVNMKLRVSKLMKARSSPDSAKANKQEIVLELQPYYFVNCSYARAEEILLNLNKEGAFLVRKKESGDSNSQPYALTIFSDSQVHHYNINKDLNNQFVLKKHNHIAKQFDSVPELIRYMNEFRICKLNTKFNHLVSNYKENFRSVRKSVFNETENEDNLNDFPYYLKKCSKEETKEILKQIGNNEIFFIRKSDTENQSIPFELIVYHKKNVYILNINKTIEKKYWVEFNDKKFNTIPELVKNYNYEALVLSPYNDELSKLSIHSKYILEI